MRYEDLVRLAQDREQWMIMIVNLLKEDAPHYDEWHEDCTYDVIFINEADFVIKTYGEKTSVGVGGYSDTSLNT